MGKILLTGANGNVGRYIASKLSKDFTLILTDIINYLNIPDFIELDITKKQLISEKFEGLYVDYVIHCAAIAHNEKNKIKDTDFWAVNYNGTKNLIDYFNNKHLKGFIFFSTVAVYGSIGTITEIDEPQPDNAYANSKLEAENYIKNNILFPYLILRFSPIYCDTMLNDIGKRVGRMIFNNFQVLIKFGNAKQKCSLCNVGNIPNLLVFFFSSPNVWMSTYNISDENPYTVLEILSFFKKRNKSIILSMPRYGLYVILRTLFFNDKKKFISFYGKLIKDNIFNNQKIKDIGFIPRNDLFS